VIDDDPHALEPTLIRLVVMAASFFEEVPDDALKCLEAISGEIDQINARFGKGAATVRIVSNLEGRDDPDGSCGNRGIRMKLEACQRQGVCRTTTAMRSSATGAVRPCRPTLSHARTAVSG
jgi:hypothetical protein